MRLTLGRWFLLWMLLVTVVSLALSVAVVTLRQRAVLRQQLEQRGRSAARTVALAAIDTAAGPVALSAMPECVAATVSVLGGELLWSYGPTVEQALTLDPWLVRIEESLTVPDGVSQRRVQVVLLLTTSRINTQVFDAGARLALTLGAALGAALLAGALLVNRVVEPLRELAEHARTFRPETPPVVAVPRGGAAEVIDLSVAFRQMAERLGDQRRRTFDEMSDGVALVDERGLPLLANRAMESFHEAVTPELTGLDPTVARHEWELRHGERTLSCALTRPEGMENRILVVRDVSEWVRAEERLREAHKMEAVATLAGGVAHDFNNLLAGILLHVRLLEKDPCTAAEVAATVRELAEEGAEVVQGLLRFAHPEATPEGRVELATLVAEQEPLLQHMMPPNIRLKVDLVDRPAPIRGRTGELRRVVLNLVLNARSALGDDGGRVVIEVREDEGSALLEVRDDGPGVAPEHRDRIFEPFFTRRRSGRGAGMGLAVVYAVVREHDGAITVDEAAGGGARFVLRFPLRPDLEAAEEAAPADAAGAEDRGQGERVLIVEDEPAIAGRLAAELIDAGYEVRCAHDLAAARSLTRQWTPELLVVDLLLPDGHGDDLVSELRERLGALPVVFATGNLETRGERLTEIERSVVLEKPFRMEELLGVLRALAE